MKNNLVNASIVVFGSLVFLFGCNQTKKTKIEKIETAENNFKLNKEPDTIKFETIYNDGRKTAVRNLKYYNYLVKSSQTIKDEKLGLTTVTSEWNKYDGNVASPQGAFIEKPLFLEEAEKKQILEAGQVDPRDMNSTMVGGDEETNSRIKEPSIRYWAVASKMFEQEFNNLKKAATISNRDTTYVTFDFITNNGFYTVQELKSELENGKSIWSNLFKESKFLNTEMARVQNESQKEFEAKQLSNKKK